MKFAYYVRKIQFSLERRIFLRISQKRELFNKLINEVKSRQIISITGLRRTGKSTLLKQLIDYLILPEKVPRENILLYSFDEEQPKILLIYITCYSIVFLKYRIC